MPVLSYNLDMAAMKKRSVETTAIFTPTDGGIISFPAVPGLTFHTDNQIIGEELEDAYDIALAKEAEARNDFVRWEDVRDSLCVMTKKVGKGSR